MLQELYDKAYAIAKTIASNDDLQVTTLNIFSNLVRHYAKELQEQRKKDLKQRYYKTRKVKTFFYKLLH